MWSKKFEVVENAAAVTGRPNQSSQPAGISQVPGSTTEHSVSNEDRLNLLIVSHTVGRHDEQGRVNYEIVRAALAAGHSVTLLSTQVDEILSQHSRVTVVRVPASRVPTRLLQHQVFALRAAAWIRAHRHEFDVVQVNGFIAWTGSDVNAIHFVHNGWYKSGYYPFQLTGGLYAAYQLLFTRLNAWCERWAFRRARVLVPVSEKVSSELVSLGISRDKIRVIHSGVDNVKFSPDLSQTSQRERFKLPEDPFMLLFAGDLRNARKNLDTVLRALVKCPPNVHLAVAGGVANSPYPAMAAALGVAERVHFVGMIRDMPTLMRCADAFVFPSRYEAMSLVLLEALASALPVITVHTTGGAEVVTQECGIVLDDPDNETALAEAISLIASDPLRAREMGQAAQALAATLSWQTMAARYLALFEDIAKTRKAARRNARARQETVSVKT
jgi:glycosyltransferase involved in cell wall biosynthesis